MIHLGLITKEVKVISLPRATIRRQHIANILEKHRIEFSFVDGIAAGSHAMGCAQAHLSALDAIEELPALVLEDDVSPLPGAVEISQIPDDADIIYLGVSPFGCFPWQRRYVRLFGHRAIHNLALSSLENNNWLRLHSLAGAIAILYVSPKGVEAWRRAMLTSLRRRRPFDVFTAYAMTSLNIYAPHIPVFYEEPSLQPPLKHITRQQRLNWTTTPLKPVRDGAVLRVFHNGKAIMVQACKNNDHRLEWSLVQ